MLVRLMYASRATADLDAEAVSGVVKKAKTGNARLGITSVLCCCSEGAFLQVLEGGRNAVSRLYNRIAADPRHTDVVLLGYEEITERRFAGWAMGQVNLSRLNPALVLKYSETAVLDPYAVSGAVSLALCAELVATAAIMGQG
jgi:hypothetical protein